MLHFFPFAPAIQSRFKPLLIHSFRIFWLGPYKLSGQIPVNFPLIAFGAGGATFAFDCGLPVDLIKLQGDWRSDTYLVYLEMTDHQKRTAVIAMAHALQQIGL